MIKRFFRFVRGLFVRNRDIVMVQPPSVYEFAGTPGYSLGKVVNAQPHEIAILKEAVEILNRVTGSMAFKDRVLATVFSEMDGKSHIEIYELFALRGHTVNVKMFYGTFMQNKVWHTIAIDFENDEFVHLNRYFFGDPAAAAASMIHETAHAVGFHHYSKPMTTSVPYRLGQIVEELGNKLEG